MGSLQTCQMLQLVNCIHMVKLFIPFSVCRNMILITYRLGSWKKALELNKVKHKPFYKWPRFRLERMQMAAGTVGGVCGLGQSWGQDVTLLQAGDPVHLQGENLQNGDYIPFEAGT